MSEGNKSKVPNVVVMATPGEKHVIVDEDIHSQLKVQAALRKKSMKDYLKELLDNDKKH